MSVIFTTGNAGHEYENSAGARVYGNAAIGRYEAPIKAVIRHESDLHTKNNNIVKMLYNVMTSKRNAESFVLMDEFDMFRVVGEGDKHPTNEMSEKRSKIFQHHKFASSFVITDVMLSDAQINQMQLLAENFTRAYYKTRNHFASAVFTGAVKPTLEFCGRTFDLTCADGKPLFSKDHVYGDAEVQSNNHFTTLGAGVKLDTSAVEAALTAGALNVRNMKDENGYSLGYTADTVMIPCNDRLLEQALRKVLGSEYSSNKDGALSGAINTQYGVWNLIVNPFWEVPEGVHPMAILSSDANKAFRGSVFFDRWPLTVTDREDQDTGSYVWNGKARMSAGFVNYKFADLFTILDDGKTLLHDGSVAADVATPVTL